MIYPRSNSRSCPRWNPYCSPSGRLFLVGLQQCLLDLVGWMDTAKKTLLDLGFFTPSCYKLWRNLPSLHLQYLPFSYHSIIFKQPTTWQTLSPISFSHPFPSHAWVVSPTRSWRKNPVKEDVRYSRQYFNFIVQSNDKKESQQKLAPPWALRLETGKFFGKQAFLKHCSVLL